METNTYGHGLTPLASVSGIKSITKPAVATMVANAFANFDKEFIGLSPIAGNEVDCLELWGEVQSLRARFLNIYAGFGKTGNA